LKFLWFYSFLEMNRRIIDLSLSKSFSNTGVKNRVQLVNLFKYSG
jgi:hypothetical protein